MCWEGKAWARAQMLMCRLSRQTNGKMQLFVAISLVVCVCACFVVFLPSIEWVQVCGRYWLSSEIPYELTSNAVAQLHFSRAAIFPWLVLTKRNFFGCWINFFFVCFSFLRLFIRSFILTHVFYAIFVLFFWVTEKYTRKYKRKSRESENIR